jgi:hypothetical protein
VALEDWQKRILVEKTELDAKRLRLDDFIRGPTFQQLTNLERALQLDQAQAMSSYSHILAERIKLFGGPP